ncbi:MAG: hypothetical protein NTV63_02105 [Candidatus Woesearchaeota archaeon]|nr:hypothetical protein [Candidatus Woesearchaeota archaeon]
MIILPQDFKIELRNEHILYSQIKNSYVEDGIALSAKTQIKESPIEKIVVKASSILGDKAKERAYFDGHILFTNGKSQMIFYNDLKKMLGQTVYEFNGHEEFAAPNNREFPIYAISNLEGIIVRSRESTVSLPEFTKDLRNFAEFFEMVIKKIFQLSGKRLLNGTLYIGPISYGRFSKEPIIPEEDEYEEGEEREEDSCGVKFIEELPKFIVGSAERGRKE